MVNNLTYHDTKCLLNLFSSYEEIDDNDEDHTGLILWKLNLSQQMDKLTRFQNNEVEMYDLQLQ